MENGAYIHLALSSFIGGLFYFHRKLEQRTTRLEGKLAQLEAERKRPD
jgi:hypothetical protein